MAEATDLDDIAGRIRSVREHIERAAVRAGRKPDDVRLIAVTKSVPVERIQMAIDAGVSMLGESRLQEAISKMDALESGRNLAWHFIGRLQRRKVRAVVGRFELIHSVDSLGLAEEINWRAEEAGLCQSVLVQVNIGEEASKTGFVPSAVADALNVLDTLPHLSVRGFMAIPPMAACAEAARPYFRGLRDLARSMGVRRFRRVEMNEFSMGMSQDYEVAVEEGATLVRVGTTIFGARPRQG